MIPSGEALLAQLDVPVLVLSPEGRFLYANDAACALLGSTFQALHALPSFEKAYPCFDAGGNALSLDEAPTRLACVGRQPARGVVQLSLGDGRVWLDISATPRLTEAGQVDHLVVTLRDVGSDWLSRLEAERGRVVSEQLYQSVLRAMSEGVVVHAGDGSIEFANPAAERVLGLSLDQMMGRAAVDPRWRLVDSSETPLDPKRIPSEITRETGQACDQVTLGVHRPDGELAWLSVSTDAVSVDPTTGHPSAVVATFTDITHSVLIKRELERSRERFKLVTDAFPGLLYELRSRAGRYCFTFLSGRASEFFGPWVGDLGQDASPMMAALHPEDRDAVAKSVQESEQRLTPWHWEGRLPRIDGSGWRWVRAQSVPMRDGDAVVWHGVLIDVTEQRRIAEALRHRQRVESMGELVAGVAHNFNNMLAVIIPNLELALEGPAEASRTLMQEASHAAQGAAELVRQLMRITRREPDAQPEVIDVVAMTREVGALLKRTLGGTLSLRVELPRESLFARAVRSDLNMVLLNLSFNARDALKGRTSPELVVHLSADEHELLLEVRDNGVGMSEATLLHLGEPFFTTKPPGAGTGLGVATMYGVVRSAGGRVEVESKLGQGSCFRVYLPRVEPERPAIQPESRPPRRLDGVRILVVEDEGPVREAIVRQLGSVGAQADSAADGAAGLTALEQRPYAAVVLDMNMPELSGQQVLERIRQTWPRLPVVVLSGHVGANCDLSAASAVLTKPVSRATLVDAIVEAIADQR